MDIQCAVVKPVIRTALFKGSWMPHYFFNLENGDERYFDDVGCFAADECEALSALIDVLAEYRETPLAPGTLSGLNVSIVDTAGRTVARLTM